MGDHGCELVASWAAASAHISLDFILQMLLIHCLAYCHNTPALNHAEDKPSHVQGHACSASYLSRGLTRQDRCIVSAITPADKQDGLTARFGCAASRQARSTCSPWLSYHSKPFVFNNFQDDKNLYVTDGLLHSRVATDVPLL